MRRWGAALLPVLAAAASPALAQAPTHFYCYVPDPASGNVYMSPTLPVGPVSERARYGSDFATFLRSQGKVGAGAQGYCVMRWSAAAIEESRAMRPNDPCPECGGASRFVAATWPRSGAPKTAETEVAAASTSEPTPAAPRRTSNAEAVKRANDAYARSVKDAIRASDPGVCLVNADGGLRCTKGGTVTAAATPAPKPAPMPIAGTQGGRADVCITSPNSAAPQRCVNAKPKPKPAPPRRPVPPKVGANSACAPDTVNIATGRIGVAVSPSGTTLLLSQRLTNRMFRFGNGTHSVPKEVYRLIAKGPTVNGQPPQACISYDQKAPKPKKPPRPAPESPSPPYDKSTQACTTLPRERDTVIVITDPRIFVTVSMGTLLYMKDQLGNELQLGYGNHRVRPGAYKLGIYGVTDPFNPLKRTLTACVRYVPDF